MTYENVIVLNADHSFLNVVTWKRALKLLTKGKAETVEKSNQVAKNFEGTKSFVVPKVIKLVEFINKIYKSAITFSRQNIIARDGYACAYCGTTHGKMTIDHILPVSKGGKTTWDNCVSACHPCNSRKGNKTIEDANLKLRVRPHKPSVYELLQIKYQKFSKE